MADPKTAHKNYPDDYVFQTAAAAEHALGLYSGAIAGWIHTGRLVARPAPNGDVFRPFRGARARKVRMGDIRPLVVAYKPMPRPGEPDPLIPEPRAVPSLRDRLKSRREQERNGPFDD